LTLDQVTNHSYAQLILLHRAVSRRFGAEGLRNMNTATAAAAVVWSKRGETIAKRVAQELKELCETDAKPGHQHRSD
jgi:hypothetical protein